MNDAHDNAADDQAMLERLAPRQPDPAKGEYLDENDAIKVCRACVPGSRVRKHTCGLSGLQAMLPLGGRASSSVASRMAPCGGTMADLHEEDLNKLAALVQTHVTGQPWGRHGNNPVPIELFYNHRDHATAWTVRHVLRVKGTHRHWGYASGPTILAALKAARASQTGRRQS
jgi:hypothetical protein